VVREGEADDSLDEHAASADDLVEVVHECLAERWPRLLRWRSEDAADRALLTDVRQAARRWDEQGRGRELLWRGAMLADLRRAMARGVSLTDREQRFAAASVGAEVRARRVPTGGGDGRHAGPGRRSPRSWPTCRSRPIAAGAGPRSPPAWPSAA
jgi:hypothetical protein